MKRYFICEKSKWESMTNRFCPRAGSHFIDLGDGDVLVAITFHDESAEVEFESLVGEACCLPHPSFEGDVKIKREHQDKLMKHDSFATAITAAVAAAPVAIDLPVVDPVLDPSAPVKEEASIFTVLDIAKQAGEIHPLMKLRPF
jgi:hypothetical protein